MKKVINSTLYNTETARKLGNWDNGRYGSFGYCKETLYRTKSGKYFIHGEGQTVVILGRSAPIYGETERRSSPAPTMKRANGRKRISTETIISRHSANPKKMAQKRA